MTDKKYPTPTPLAVARPLPNSQKIKSSSAENFDPKKFKLAWRAKYVSDRGKFIRTPRGWWCSFWIEGIWKKRVWRKNLSVQMDKIFPRKWELKVVPK